MRRVRDGVKGCADGAHAILRCSILRYSIRAAVIGLLGLVVVSCRAERAFYCPPPPSWVGLINVSQVPVTPLPYPHAIRGPRYTPQTPSLCGNARVGDTRSLLGVTDDGRWEGCECVVDRDRACQCSEAEMVEIARLEVSVDDLEVLESTCGSPARDQVLGFRDGVLGPIAAGGWTPQSGELPGGEWQQSGSVVLCMHWGDGAPRWEAVRIVTFGAEEQ